MPVVAQATNGGGNASASAAVPFQIGSFQYAEQVFTDVIQLGANTTEFIHNITPGGFLRGIDLMITSAGGVAGVLAADAPLNLIQSASLENIDGSPIIYPLSGYTLGMWQKFCAPWLGEPFNPNQLYNTAQATPGWLLHLWPEIYGTAGVLANTDARAQYRIRYTVNTAAAVAAGYTTNPTLTITGFLNSWAQPDQQDLHGNPIQNIPPGLNCARIVRHQVANLAAAGGDNVIQLTNTGNEIRNIMLIIRDQNNVRADAISGVLRVRLDDRSLGTFSTQELLDKAVRFYPTLQNNTFPRPTGVYVFPRFKSATPNNGLELFGDFWLPTSNATYLALEFTTGAGPTGGTVEIVTDEVVPQNIPSDLEGI